MKRWYVVQTHARREDQAVHHLKRQGFKVYLPRYLKKRRHARKIDWHPFPLFPRYLFVSFDLNINQWRSIHSTVGVSRLIMFGDKPIPVPAGVVEGIQAREDEKGMVGLGHNGSLQTGDTAQVLDGALSEFDCIFDHADDRQRAFVFLEFLGRMVKVRLPIESIGIFA